jgi:hypothetical protein
MLKSRIEEGERMAGAAEHDRDVRGGEMGRRRTIKMLSDAEEVEKEARWAKFAETQRGAAIGNIEESWSPDCFKIEWTLRLLRNWLAVDEIENSEEEVRGLERDEVLHARATYAHNRKTVRYHGPDELGPLQECRAGVGADHERVIETE